MALATRGFASLLACQALGAFNDNAFKTYVALLAVASLPPEKASGLIAAAGALFIAPFLLFSTVAGAAADRWPKKKLLIAFKAVELLLMAAAVPALASGALLPVCLLIFLMGAHSAFFGPVKLAILPEVLEDKDLSEANGLMQLTTFAGIILGTVAAGALIGKSGSATPALTFLAAAAAGLAASFFCPDPPASGRASRVQWPWESLKSLARLPAVYEATIGSAFFWFVGAIFQMNLLMYGRTLMGLPESRLSLFQILLALGIGLGSALAGRMSRGKVELGMTALGAFGLVAFSLDLAFSFRSTSRTMIDLVLVGASAGAFAVPLQAFIQQHTPAEQRGRVIATGNLVTCGAVLVASGWLWLYSDVFGLHPGQIFLATAAMTLAVAAYLVWRMPEAFVRALLLIPAGIFYRIKPVGRENVPNEGPCLLVANHVSFIDAFLIALANQRRIRFLMFRAYYDLPVVGWFFKAMGCIPISDRDGPKALIESFRRAQDFLRQGEAVAIFAEGEISRHGQMLRFKKGFERIVDGLDVPVIPVHLDEVWGSIFSFEGGRALFKKPKRIPYPVTVSMGRPLPSTSTPFQVRQAILELGCEAFKHRLCSTPSLPAAWLGSALRRPWRRALSDSFGVSLRAGPAAVAVLAMRRALEPLVSGKNVGVLLPPCVPAVLVNVALSAMGKVPVNLNYTASRELIDSCRAKAGIETLITSRKLLQKLGWPEPAGALYIDDVKLSPLAALPDLLRPSRWGRAGLDDTAAILFTSGSTGDPKGVMLSHANILHNVLAMGQLFPTDADDRMLGALPFFHSFGLTVTLWFPGIQGFGAVYHPNPLDSRAVGDLAEKHRVTFLLGTPTFLGGYLRRIDAAKLKTVRVVVAGAEKLRADVADAFEAKFGVRPLEGYGCTELSPVVSVNIPDIDWPGSKQKGTKAGTVGQPLPGVFVKIVDPDTGAPLPQDAPGLLLVKGPNVMQGYIGQESPLRDGYYVTGDIASIDADGFVTITDRLSRFSKIAGEMVPHIKVEEKLHELAGATDQTFVVLGAPDEKRGEKLLVLHLPRPDLDELHKKLAAALPALWAPDRRDYRQVESFPVLGTGKLDLRALKELGKAAAA